MQSLKRLYLYAVAFVSLEVVLWGTISLARAFFAERQSLGGPDRLAQALSLILVGIPVFLLHWWLVQRATRAEPAERSALLRAIFIYGVLMVTLLPVVNNTLALLDRLLAMAFGLDPTLAALGGVQTFSDNLIAILPNAIAAAYFYIVLRADWAAGPLGDDFSLLRRLFRYLAMLYFLFMSVIGIQRFLEYLLRLLQPALPAELSMLSSGLALLVVGLPLWLYCWRLILLTWDEPAERDSLLRWIVLLGVVLVSAVVSLVCLIIILQSVLVVVLGQRMPPGEFLDGIAIPLSVVVPFAAIWVYFSRLVRAESASQPGSPAQEAERRAGLRRIYAYSMAAFSLAASTLGLVLFLISALDFVMPQGMPWDLELRSRMAGGMALLLVGLPVWIVLWRPLTREAAADGESGEDARRSLVRRGYLYLALFAGVMGVMFSAGALLYQLLSALLGEAVNDLLFQSLQMLLTLLVFALLLGYHGWVLRRDNQITGRLLARRRAQYPVLVLAPSQAGFSEAMVAALEREAPGIPVAVHPIEQGAPDETFSAAKAVILPSELLARPSEALRLWLQSFDGKRLVVPTPIGDWLWVSGRGGSMPSQARRAALLARRLAEGELEPK